jgi:hypothetical protein
MKVLTFNGSPLEDCFAYASGLLDLFRPVVMFLFESIGCTLKRYSLDFLHDPRVHNGVLKLNSNKYHFDQNYIL